MMSDQPAQVGLGPLGPASEASLCCDRGGDGRVYSGPPAPASAIVHPTGESYLGSGGLLPIIAGIP